MKSIRRILGVVVTTGVLAVGLGLPATGTANASAVASASFTWKNGMDTGGCSMFKNATWTLYSDGTAKFDATVESYSGDDAWLMHALLKDDRGAVLAEIQVDNSSSTKFVKGLPRAWERYRWLARGHFDPSLYPMVEIMSMTKHC